MKRETYLILDNIRSCENVGSIFRTADGVGVSKIFLCGITPTPVEESTLLRPFSTEVSEGRQGYGGHSKISKTALGAEKWVPWEYYTQTWKCLRELKNQNSKIKIIGLEQTKDSQNIFKFKPKFPMALVVGNEVKGISPKILKYCDKVVHIPMHGRKKSLNVSVATGVVLYQLIWNL